MEKMQKLQAYKELLAVAEKYKEVLKDDQDFSTDILLSFIKRTELEGQFGLKLKHSHFATSSYEVENVWDGWTRLSFHGEDSQQTISWSDDGRQPKNEWLFKICFPTGAYIFGDSYPTETFTKFFDELKSYAPKYSDTCNKCLYFTEETSKAVYENFWSIYKKHQAMVAEEMKEQRKKKLQTELKELEG